MAVDPYFDVEHGVLRNRLGITDPAELGRIEARITAMVGQELDEQPVAGVFDLRHLQAIHRRLFGPLYDWAGELRTVNISKPGSPFCPAARLESFAREVFGEIERGHALRRLPYDRAVDRLVHHLAEVNALHPFREGNGRAYRAFFRHWAREAQVDLDWRGLDPERNGHAFRVSLAGHLEPLRALIAERVRPLDRTRDRGSGIDR
ncbi:MAG: Fic family protein [Solirubrobacteraceae bacterium]|nr:Fic family protein [Solirubrobacteraceae bacterium]